MDKTWILIANSERARCFERDAQAHTLREQHDFVHPESNFSSKVVAGDRSGDAGKGHGRTGHAGTQFEPHTEAHAKERHTFARQLAQYLNEGVTRQQCKHLILIASSALLGELRPLLNNAAQQALHTSIASDLTHYEGPELQQRVDHALALSH